MSLRGQSLLQRFWSKVDRTGDCWLWTGYCQPNGYGRFSYSVLRHGFAHRLSYELFRGSPEGRYVLHTCDNPPCVNPDHLFLGTQRDNILDSVSKGRWHGAKPGQGQRHYKLPLNQRDAIRSRYALGHVSQDSLATEYGVSQSMIGRIVRREGLR